MSIRMRLSSMARRADCRRSSGWGWFIARLEKSYSKGVSFLASYTWSKLIDNSSAAGNLGPQPERAQNMYNLAAENGPSYYDVPHRLALSAVWDLPFLRRNTGLAGAALGGWQLSMIAQFQSGNPWSAITSRDQANVGNLNQRLNVIGNPLPEGFVRGGASRRAFDPAAFALAPRGTFGNSGRNILRDAGMNNWDVGLNKTFRMSERMALEFRGEAFNVANRTQFLRFDNVIDNPTFGIWNSARDPRIFQLALKLIR